MTRSKLMMISVLVGLILVAVSAAFGQQRNTGLLFADPDRYEKKPLRLALGALKAGGEVASLPPSIDLSSEFPSPGDQGNMKSCVAWAVAYGLKSQQEFRERKWPLTSQSHLFSPSYVYNQICKGTDAGSYFENALDLLRQQGVAALSVFPYTPDIRVMPDSSDRSAASPFKIRSYTPAARETPSVKTYLSQKIPVLIGAMVDESFKQLGQGRIFDHFSGSGGGHAMVVVGYDDAKGNGAFKVLNSWGEQWGDRGYGWIAYATFGEMVREAWVVTDEIGTAHSPEILAPTETPPPMMSFRSVNLNITPNVPGGLLNLTVDGDLQGCMGHRVQIVTRYYKSSGPPQFLLGPPLLQRNGRIPITTSTSTVEIQTDRFYLSTMPMSIPLATLNFIPTGGRMQVHFGFLISVYMDDKLVSQSRPKFWGFMW